MKLSPPVNRAADADFRTGAPQMNLRDLSRPEYTPESVPQWARPRIPAWVEPYVGMNGMPEIWRQHIPGANCLNVSGIDRYHANHFVVWRPETEEFIEKNYTPLEIRWPTGKMPAIEQAARGAAGHLREPFEIVQAFLDGPCRSIRQPVVPPLGFSHPSSLALGEEELLAKGLGWCNEQARVFVRLCQSRGIPARLIHVFYKTVPTGHTLAEFHTGAKWCLVDLTYHFICLDTDGNALSAADCHDRGPGQRRFGELYYESIQRMLEEVRRIPEGERSTHLAKWIAFKEQATPTSCAEELDFFGVMDYPPPPPGD